MEQKENAKYQEERENKACAERREREKKLTEKREMRQNSNLNFSFSRISLVLLDI